MAFTVTHEQMSLAYAGYTGGTFTYAAGPGDSGAPPATVPRHMGTLVTGKVAKSGSSLKGTITRIVVVRTSSYGTLSAGGTGTVVARVC